MVCGTNTKTHSAWEKEVLKEIISKNLEQAQIKRPNTWH
jgi:hypothetical protein